MPSRREYCALVIGASSAIAQQLIKQLSSDEQIKTIYAISRQHTNSPTGIKVVPLTCNNTETEILANLEQIDTLLPVRYVFICNGFLYGQQPITQAEITPEKRLEDISPENMLALMQSNMLVPLMWLKHLVHQLPTKLESHIVIFSARVGSINDNRLGGWYSYRASKAALNMMIKNAAIEYGRRLKQAKIIAFHPGTTDTPLSKPFQAKVAKEKLFTAEFVAAQLLSLLPNYPPNGQASFIDWQGQAIDW
ncbi:SDR family NAD(P)-dependent oxidoreductase [Motilimonas sp. 1_MG-2023]|uniref:SDR family NAD(P)-dependent oxidoreductase n=1 Tax=Motilimonas sp. 1_MG-2023 TaxID=3062672 RepID=UPI0026E30843|nr:SDR family NAD(P)-dependent oxidoreductase [Motilimonas sp. 1_MG-2023]MDO6524601.1 SDR family NAD(P)-dependent oxidoreductase [Motilimonas sp. 1_MG-2023]